MPTYEYRCQDCEHQFEVFARMSDPDPETCPDCDTTGTLQKVLFPVAVHYKGSGFYSTDYSGSKNAAGATASTSESSSSSSSSDASSSSDSSSSAASDSGSSSAKSAPATTD